MSYMMCYDCCQSLYTMIAPQMTHANAAKHLFFYILTHSSVALNMCQQLIVATLKILNTRGQRKEAAICQISPPWRHYIPSGQSYLHNHFLIILVIF